MKVLYLDISIFFANMDMLDALEKYTDSEGNHLEIVKYPYAYEEKKATNDPVFEADFLKAIRSANPDFVFSFNFLPVVSKVCNIDGVKYVSWVYDNPEVFLYSCQVINPCNIVLMFDSKEFEIFRTNGIKTVHYMPLAANPARLRRIIEDKGQQELFKGSRFFNKADIAFVGAMYDEEHTFFKRLKSIWHHWHIHEFFFTNKCHGFMIIYHEW